MPEQTQTPASRRFLPQSSSSRPQHQSSSARRTPFTKPSHPHHSSPFSRTLFQGRAHIQDDIDTSFDHGSTSSRSVETHHSVKLTYSRTDSIEDVGDEEMQGYDQRRLSSPFEDSNDVHEERARTYIHDLPSSPGVDFTSPLPKRQKMSHAQQNETFIRISSSSESNDGDSDSNDLPEQPGNSTTVHNTRTAAVGSDNNKMEEDDVELCGTADRFRIKQEAVTGDKYSTQHKGHRSLFKDISAGAVNWAETPLPTTFSPSKRKGKYEYTYGGSAETVRSWILDVANEQSKSGLEKKTQMHTTTMWTDQDRRFDIVANTEDEVWMLVHQENQKRPGQTTHEQVDSKLMGVTLKGKGTTWNVKTSNYNRTDDCKADLHIAVLWE